MAKRVLVLVTAGVVGLSLVLSGCGQKNAAKESTAATTQETQKPAEKVKITFWDENAGPNRTPFYDELIKKFHESNNEVEVEYVGIPWSDAKQKYDLAIAANEVPDCAGVSPSWLSNFYAKQAVIPLDAYMEKWSEKDKFAKAQTDLVRSMVPDKKLYLIPNTSNVEPLIWYRADWFKEANLSEPKTWDEFFADIEKLTDKSKNRYGYSIRGGAGGEVQLQMFLYAYSGISESFDSNGKSTIDDSKHLEALKRLVGIYMKSTPESDIGNGYKEMVAAFDTGVAAMIQHNLGSYGEHNKTFSAGQFASFITPKGASGVRVVILGQNGYSIFNSSTKKDAAWTFISYLSNAENQGYWNKNIGQIPTNMDALKQDWIKDARHINTALAVVSEPDTKAISFPAYLPDYTTIMQKQVRIDFQAVLAGKKTPEAMLKEWADAFTKAKADYDKLPK